MTKRYLVTWAQNATPVHKGFWAVLQTCAKKTKSEILVIAGRYKNPTSVWSLRSEHDEWWADDVQDHLMGRLKRDETFKNSRQKLCRNLTVYGDIPIQPTAGRPLSGFEGLTGESSGIFGHPKRAMQTVPTSTRMPRVMWTTGACTVANYTDSKAGKKGHHHHVLGALVVEIQDDGGYHIRNITWDERTRSFTDLGDRWTASGQEDAPPAESLTIGDWHHGRMPREVEAAHQALANLIRAKVCVLHDFLDFEARNPHEKGRRSRYAKRFKRVEYEVASAAARLKAIAAWRKWRVAVVRSNHDEMFDRWLDGEHDGARDPHNDPYFCQMWVRLYDAFERTGAWPDAFALECKRLKVPSAVKFLKLNESLRIKGVEHGFHGHRGPGGSKGSTLGFTRLGTKATKGHDHLPAIVDGVFSVGVGGELDHGYNALPSGWLVADTVLHADGKRQLIAIVDGEFAAGGVRRWR